jgi:tetratricopeptide (TPR) repeat protein
VTYIGGTPFSACAAAAAEVRQTRVFNPFALQACDHAVRVSPALPAEIAVAYVNRSVIDLTLADATAALVDTAAAMRMDPGLAEAYLNRGLALAAAHRSGEAIQAFGEAIRLHVPRPEQAWFDRATVREDDGDLGGAYSDYRRASELNPEWDSPRKELSRFSVH